MKKVIYLLSLSSLMLISCGGEEKKEDKKKEDNKENKEGATAEKVMYSVDPAATTLEWTGYEGNDPTTHFHTGVISVTEGSIIAEGTQITGGDFKIDMLSIQETTDGKPEEKKAKLVGHLGNEDFFQVEAHPTATFLITGVDGKNVSGQLNVLGKTLDITIPVEVNVEAESISVAAEFSVDMSSLGMPGLQAEEGADPEEVINSKVNFVLRLKGNK